MPLQRFCPLRISFFSEQSPFSLDVVKKEQVDINVLQQAAEQGDDVWIEQLTQAAEQGDARAQSLLASCYEVGRYVSKNKQEAMKWHAKAAAQGFSFSRLRLEELKSPVKAFFKRLFRRY